MKKRIGLLILCVIMTVFMLSDAAFAEEIMDIPADTVQMQEETGIQLSEADCTHDLMIIEACAPTLTAEGNLEYYECCNCHKLFRDSDGAEEIQQEDTVVPKLIDIADVKVTGLANRTYTGSAAEQNLVLTYNHTKLVQDRDYYLLYSNHYNAGKALVTITGTGLYGGKKQLEFTIAPKKLTPKITLYDKAFVYDGKAKTPSFSVEADNMWMDPSAYKVTYDKGRKAIGRYKVTVKLTGNYSGSASAYFTIKPVTTEIVSVVPVNYKTVTVKWKKRGAGGITGYQVQYSPKEDFSSGRKTVTVKGAKKNSVKLTKLKADTYYSIRVRTYKQVNDRKIVSDWSDIYGIQTYAHISKPFVQTRSIRKIRAFFKKHPVDLALPVSYSVQPKVSAPFKAGVLSAASKKNALNMVNRYRFLAGIDANVKLDSTYCKETQAAALVNAANNFLSHFPGKPAGMSQSLYELGCEGASSSNLAMSYGNTASTVGLYMSDSDEYNIHMLGHRRWVLNPGMRKTGFGHVGSYSAMKTFDSGTPSKDYCGVVWPAQKTPLGYFSVYDAWSVSMGWNVDANKIKVIVQRVNDKKRWVFSAARADGFFNVNNDYYGLSGCIIFRPDNLGDLKDGDIFKITIKGMPTGGFSYTVRFFKL